MLNEGIYDKEMYVKEMYDKEMYDNDNGSSRESPRPVDSAKPRAVS